MNEIEIEFNECSPAPANGYFIYYRPVGSLDPHEQVGPFFSSPAIFTESDNPDGTQFEGYIQSDCGGGNLGNEIPFETVPEGSGSESSSPGSESGGGDFSFTPLTEDYSRPFAGNYRWNEKSGDQIVHFAPEPLCDYRRFSVLDFGEGAGSGSPDFTKFDSKVQDAINAGHTFAFGIMTVYPFPDFGGFNIVDTYDGGTSVYPETWHNAFQAAGGDNADWLSSVDSNWIPPGNGALYHQYLNDFHAEIYNHIQSTSYVATAGPHDGETVNFEDVIEFIDIRGWGAYGEWHSGGIVSSNVSEYPAGKFPTIAGFQAIIDAHSNQFPDWPLIAIIHVFDHGTFDNTEIPVEIGEYIMDNGNTWGDIGWRNDHFGDDQGGSPGGYDIQVIDDFPTRDVFNRWQTAPVVGEPPGYDHNSDCGFPQCKAEFLADKYHYAYEGNGNFGGDNPGADTENAMLDAFAVSGHIIRPTGGSHTFFGATWEISIDWRNYGVSRAYDRSFECQFFLRDNTTAIVWSEVSAFVVHNLQPAGSSTNVTDEFATPALSPGTYDLYVIFPDQKNNYRAPFPLGIEGRESDGSYHLAQVIFT